MTIARAQTMWPVRRSRRSILRTAAFSGLGAYGRAAGLRERATMRASRIVHPPRGTVITIYFCAIVVIVEEPYHRRVTTVLAPSGATCHDAGRDGMRETDRRMRLLEILRLRGGQTIADLVRALRMSRNAVRNLLMRLQAEGLARPQGLRPGKRRPSVVYGLAPDAEVLFLRSYDAFVLTLLEALGKRDGRTLRKVLDQVADRWIARDRPRVMQHHGEKRLQAVRDLLSERRFMPVLVQADGACEIPEHNCPLSRLVSEHPEVCDTVHRCLAGLVEAEVVRVRWMAHGDPYSVCRVSLSAPRYQPVRPSPRTRPGSSRRPS